MRRRSAVLAAALAAVLLSGCSLPLPGGVRESEVSLSGAGGSRDIEVLPPGPQAGATPVEIVQGFLGAEGSLQGDHRVARSYLTDQAVWLTDRAEVYDPASVQVAESVTAAGTGPNEAEVQVSFERVGTKHADGRYEAQPRTMVTEAYRVVRPAGGQWRISRPPPGLRLTPADRDRSFPARKLYYLSRSGPPRVVPDRVLLPDDGPPAKAEVERLLTGPSDALAASVDTAFPLGTRLRSVRRTASGRYRVDLSRQVLQAGDQARRGLSAQLVWTLRALDPRFEELVLTAAGAPLRVPGAGAAQGRDAWLAFDSEELEPGPAYYVAGGKVRLTSGPGDQALPGTRGLLVQAVAASPDRSRLAVVERAAAGRPPQLRVSDAPGSARLPVRLRGQGLTSLSWGSGEHGVWLVDGAGRVLLTPAKGSPRVVSVPGLPARVSALALSRDGVRAALVSGGRLYVGQVAVTARAARIDRLQPVSPDITRITGITWRDGTSLVVLGALSGTFLPVQVSVDGASLRPLPVSSLPGQPLEVAAYPHGIIVTAGDRLYVQGQLGFRPGPVGAHPAYPG